MSKKRSHKIKGVKPLWSGTKTSAVCVLTYLWGNYEQRGLCIKLSQSLRHVGTVDVGDKPHIWATSWVWLQSLRHHQWTLKATWWHLESASVESHGITEVKSIPHQVGAPNSDVDDIGDAFPTKALPLAAPDSLGKGRRLSVTFLSSPVASAKVAVAAGTYVAEGLHLVQHTVHLRHHIVSVNRDGVIWTIPQSNVEHGTALKTHTPKLFSLNFDP